MLEMGSHWDRRTPPLRLRLIQRFASTFVLCRRCFVAVGIALVFVFVVVRSQVAGLRSYNSGEIGTKRNGGGSGRARSPQGGIATTAAENRSVAGMVTSAKTGAAPGSSPKSRREGWDRWFRPLVDGRDRVGVPPVNLTGPPFSQGGWGSCNILYYHVQKTGGSSLSRMFESLNRRNGFTNPGLGRNSKFNEDPGSLDRYVDWRRSTARNGTVAFSGSSCKLLIASFREPVERSISHYFQVKPCPDGTGGGFNVICRKAARDPGGIMAYNRHCKFARNWQSKYVDGDNNKLENFDALVRTYRFEESLLLMALRYSVPVLDLLVVSNKNVRVTSDQIFLEGTENSASEAGHAELSCTAQWMRSLIPQEKLRDAEACMRAACAGKIGRLALTDTEIHAVKEMNKDDLILWEEFVVPQYEKDRRDMLELYGTTQRDLDDAVELYISAAERYQEQKFNDAAPGVEAQRQKKLPRALVQVDTQGQKRQAGKGSASEETEVNE